MINLVINFIYSELDNYLIIAWRKTIDDIFTLNSKNASSTGWVIMKISFYSDDQIPFRLSKIKDFSRNSWSLVYRCFFTLLVQSCNIIFYNISS